MADVVTQMRCPLCDAERYIMAVIAASNGEAPCHRCGKTAPIYHDEGDYRTALRHVRERNWARRGVDA